MDFTSLSYSFLHFSTNSPSSFFLPKYTFLYTFLYVQQLSTLKRKSFCFVFTSSFKNNIENENIRKNLFHSILLNFEYQGTFYTVQFFFGARHENPKVNKRGGPNNSGGGRIFFFKKK